MSEKNNTLTADPNLAPTVSLGLLLLRVAIGGMMLVHGLPKLMNLLSGSIEFADPLGLGPQLSLVLAVGAEVGCSLLLIFGLFTRLATLPLIVTMTVAVLIIHADDPYSKKEMALLYLVPYLTLLFSGAGQFSLDQLVWPRLKSLTTKKEDGVDA